MLASLNDMEVILQPGRWILEILCINEYHDMIVAAIRLSHLYRETELYSELTKTLAKVVYQMDRW